MTEQNLRDWVHKRHIHLDSFGDQVFNLSQHGEVILSLDVLWICSIQTSYEAPKRCDTYSLSDAKNSCEVKLT